MDVVTEDVNLVFVRQEDAEDGGDGGGCAVAIPEGKNRRKRSLKVSVHLQKPPNNPIPLPCKAAVIKGAH